MSVHSLSDLKKREEEEEKRKTDFFTGGSRSALAVTNPNIKALAQRARLLPNNPGPPNPDETRIKITLWANGFQVDDGPLRLYESPENARFIADINQGRTPAELLQRTQGKPITVTLSDRSRDEFQTSGSRVAVFGGSGHRLVMANSTAVGSVNLSTPVPYFNPNYPLTTVKVLFHDGKQKELTVNETTRVGAIRDFVMRAAPVAGNFELGAGFPPTPLLNMRLTVQEAEIANSSVRQKLV